MHNILEKVALMAAIALPFFNIPLIVKIIQRKSSQDISLVWVLGAWTCIILMAPSGFISKDIVFRTFNVCNVVFFSLVLLVTLKYRKGPLFNGQAKK